MMTEVAQDVVMIPIEEINVLNPRVRNRRVFGEIVDNIGKVLDETLSEGQKKAMEGSFSAGTVDPGKKPEEVTALAKRNFFIRNVLLDPLTRELLIEIADHSN